MHVEEPVLNFGAAVIASSPGSLVDPWLLGSVDENDVQGYDGTPVNVNSFMFNYKVDVGAAGAVYARPKTYYFSIDSPTLPDVNETVGGQMLRQMILSKAEDVDEQVLVVVPALNSPIRHWASDEDDARAAAAERLERSLQRLKDAGVGATGMVGDGDPLQAAEDALRTFGADEIVISTHPEGKSHWLERGVVQKARERFTVPVTHVVTDLAAESEEIRT
jgi:hypothetical protein